REVIEANAPSVAFPQHPTLHHIERRSQRITNATLQGWREAYTHRARIRDCTILIEFSVRPISRGATQPSLLECHACVTRVSPWPCHFFMKGCSSWSANAPVSFRICWRSSSTSEFRHPPRHSCPNQPSPKP